MAMLTRIPGFSVESVETALGTLTVCAPNTCIRYLPIEIFDLVLEHLSIEEVVHISLVSPVFVAVCAAVC